jgi:hypothetical protein
MGTEGLNRMAIDWQECVRRNIHSIVNAATAAQMGAETVCVLLDVDQARAGHASPGAMHLIAQTKLRGAVPLTEPDGSRLACIPLCIDDLVAILSPNEETDVLETRIRNRGSIALWAVCLDGDERVCIDVHVAGPEHN